MNYKKGISSIIAISLLIVVTVIAVVSFQTWFQSYSSSMFSDIETKKYDSDLNIETIIDNNLYIKSNYDNIIINKIQINGIDCKSNITINKGLNNISITDCLNNLETSTPNIILINNENIIEKIIYLNKITNINISSNYNFIESCNNTGGFNAGDGSIGNPYEICNCTQLQNIETSPSGVFILISDIDCSNTKNWNSQSGFSPLGLNGNVGFDGTIDGQNYNIVDLFINKSTTNNIGFIGISWSNVKIKNLNLININITGKDNVGGLIGIIYDSSSFNNISIEGNIYGASKIGSIIGSIDMTMPTENTINNSNTNTKLNGTGSQIGGLIGFGTLLTIENSYSTGNINGASYLGGLVGSTLGGVKIKNSYATENINGGGRIGGIIGYTTTSDTITNTYSTTNILGTLTDIGGLVGENGGATISNSYWDTDTSGQLSSAGGTGKTTIEMYQELTYSGWDFTNIWSINEGNDYPKLK